MAHATRAALVRSQNASRGHARGCLATVTDRAEARYQRRARTNSTALRAREGLHVYELIIFDNYKTTL